METSWLIRLDLRDAASLSALRLTPDLEVAVAAGEVWLRGARGDGDLDRALAGLPALERYERTSDNRLRPLRRRVPTRKVPDLSWLPLRAWAQVFLPQAALPGIPPEPVALRLERSGEERDAVFLMSQLEAFHRFATDAPRVRLDPLRFAASSDGLVLIHGTPLPPLPGQRFVLHGRVAIPAGFSWAPRVDAEVLARRFAAGPDTIVLWETDGRLSRFQSEQFVPVTRSAVKATRVHLQISE